MNRQHKDYIRGRKSVLDDQQVNTDRLDRSPKKRQRPLRKVIPLLVFAFIALMIAREEIPLVGSTWERLVSPDKWLARQSCEKAAVASVQRKEFARILKPGTVNKTTDGWYIERLQIGEMGQSGDEIPVEYSCYLDAAKNLVTLNRDGNAIFSSNDE